ncbi:hypothetical protein K431DRAFT_286029 [Polychaeton citri CBS 116435]|uniref:Uncharacterized protein n=1 Tax=Polychaeton citri CBS 116435 TaxID=1314669 RepID=A0A9P4Q405_9PEZI|nr:hypothetical protein K431DRAFT_286029 [Polychaeton citri CBS 116435]
MAYGTSGSALGTSESQNCGAHRPEREGANKGSESTMDVKTPQDLDTSAYFSDLVRSDSMSLLP